VRRPRELLAAATRWTARRFRTSQPDQSWQHRAWAYYDSTPEVRFAAAWIGNAMGRGWLFAGTRDKDGTVKPPPNSHRAPELVVSIARPVPPEGALTSAPVFDTLLFRTLF
jgi:hypothetical protein